MYLYRLCWLLPTHRHLISLDKRCAFSKTPLALPAIKQACKHMSTQLGHKVRCVYVNERGYVCVCEWCNIYIHTYTQSERLLFKRSGCCCGRIQRRQRTHSQVRLYCTYMHIHACMLCEKPLSGVHEFINEHVC